MDKHYVYNSDTTLYRNNGAGADRPWGSGYRDTYYRFTDDWANNVIEFEFKKDSSASTTRTVTYTLTNPGGT